MLTGASLPELLRSIAARVGVTVTDLQLRLAEFSPEGDVVFRLSQEGRTKRIRRLAADRLKRL